ncbi:hypothetical protein DsansV1_C05g0056231 [Dioscorea sansibarensis]
MLYGIIYLYHRNSMIPNPCTIISSSFGMKSYWLNESEKGIRVCPKFQLVVKLQTSTGSNLKGKMVSLISSPPCLGLLVQLLRMLVLIV